MTFWLTGSMGSFRHRSRGHSRAVEHVGKTKSQVRRDQLHTDQEIEVQAEANLGDKGRYHPSVPCSYCAILRIVHHVEFWRKQAFGWTRLGQRQSPLRTWSAGNQWFLCAIDKVSVVEDWYGLAD